MKCPHCGGEVRVHLQAEGKTLVEVFTVEEKIRQELPVRAKVIEALNEQTGAVIRDKKKEARARWREKNRVKLAEQEKARRAR